MAPHVRFSGAFCIDPSNRMETRLLDFRILADCHHLVCVEIPSRGSSGSPQTAQAKAVYTKLGVTPSGHPVALRFHAEVLRALPGFRAIWRCGPTLLQDRESGAATPRKSGRLIASASRRSPSGTSCHTPGCRRPFSAGCGNRCLCSAGSAATNATPGRPKSTIQDRIQFVGFF